MEQLGLEEMTEAEADAGKIPGKEVATSDIDDGDMAKCPIGYSILLSGFIADYNPTNMNKVADLLPYTLDALASFPPCILLAPHYIPLHDPGWRQGDHAQTRGDHTWLQ